MKEHDGEQRIYFVTETKGCKNGNHILRDAERTKIKCAKRHFEALELVDSFKYDVETNYVYGSVEF